VLIKWLNLKIAGVVNSYNEALVIEDITKTFLIEERILNLLPLRNKKNFKNMTNPNTKIFPKKDIQNSELFNKNNLHIKNNEDFRSVFNVRGLS